MIELHGGVPLKQKEIATNVDSPDASLEKVEQFVNCGFGRINFAGCRFSKGLKFIGCVIRVSERNGDVTTGMLVAARWINGTIGPRPLGLRRRTKDDQHPDCFGFLARLRSRGARISVGAEKGRFSYRLISDESCGAQHTEANQAQLPAVIYGNDEITCGNSYSIIW